MFWKGLRSMGNKPSSSTVSSAADEIFRKLDHLLADESAQLDGLPDFHREKALAGIDCDELPGARGEFGRSIENAIPVNGPLGEVIYLSKLRGPTGNRIMFHRLGSCQSVDVYELVDQDGKSWDILFIDPYHPRKSRKAPTGYTLNNNLERHFFGANFFLLEFPKNLPKAVSDTCMNLIGLRMVAKEIRLALEASQFKRPPMHVLKVMQIIHSLDNKFPGRPDQPEASDSA